MMSVDTCRDKMEFAILCLCLVSTACAVPFQYLPHFPGSRQQQPPVQGNNPFSSGFPQPGLPGAYSIELIYPHRFPGGTTGGANPTQPFSSYGFIKYSIPQPPGRQSLEIFYPYDFSQQRIVQNLPPMSNQPIMPDVFPIEYPPQNMPQQTINKPNSDAKAVPSQDPLQSLLQNKPTQASQVHPKV
uniref:Secretory calcium-binding phosphoprotein 5 n=2 Tax=Oryzias sinensis TaxID=183150 RepID=A0A8C7Y893_9TELE